MSITVSEFGRLSDGRTVHAYTLRTPEGCGFCALDYGGYLKNLWVKDQAGKLTDVCLGFDQLSQYEFGPNGCAGALIGRVGNRIGGAKFILRGREYILAANNGPNNLHSGPEGFQRKMWSVTPKEPDTLVFRYLSPDGEMGFPGSLDVQVEYTFTAENRLRIRYHAVSDKDTLCNLTNHAYFNLKGSGQGSILDHSLQINAKYVTAVDDGLIPTGELVPVEKVPYDFHNFIQIGKQIARLKEDAQYALVGGVDFNYCAGNPGVEKTIASLYSPDSRIRMDVITDQPGVQAYMAMSFNMEGKDGAHYKPFAGIALETQHYPDAIHHDNFPSIVLKAGESYDTFTEYAFSIC